MPEMLPIIFIHKHNNDYLPISLWKARETNPDSEIILIGDSQNAHFGAWVRHVNQHKFQTNATLFAKKFKNFSTNPHNFELICLQRWLILEEFLNVNKIDSCLYLDSDVLLFEQINDDANRFSKFGMTVAGISGHTNFINGIETLSSFCRFIESAYSDEKNISVLSEKYQTFLLTHKAGGISDMTFFTEFREKYPLKVLDIAEPIDNKMFDITITYTKGYKETAGVKSLTWKNKMPYVQSVTDRYIEMRTLHFQGNSKKEMKQMAYINSTTFELLYLLNKAYLLLQKVWNKIKF